MPNVFIPPQLRDLTNGEGQITIQANNVRELIAALEERFPGVQTRLQDGDRLTPGIAVSIDGVMHSQQGLLAKVSPDSEIHFLPALSGG